MYLGGGEMFLKILLSAIPFIWVIGMLPFANRVHPMILGLPFIAAWTAAGCFVSAGCLYLLYEIHGRAEHEKEEREGK